MTTEGPIPDGELAARISKTVVRALARTTGRGPTKAKTTLGANGVFVVLQDTLTRGEQTLADAGQHEAVLDLRHRWQMIMKNDVSREMSVRNIGSELNLSPENATFAADLIAIQLRTVAGVKRRSSARLIAVPLIGA